MRREPGAQLAPGCREHRQVLPVEGGGGGQAPMHLIRAIYVWPLHSPRAKRSRWGVLTALPQSGLRGRGDATKGPVPPC
jgi:hypothetical protein